MVIDGYGLNMYFYIMCFEFIVLFYFFNRGVSKDITERSRLFLRVCCMSIVFLYFIHVHICFIGFSTYFYILFSVLWKYCEFVELTASFCARPKRLYEEMQGEGGNMADCRWGVRWVGTSLGYECPLCPLQ